MQFIKPQTKKTVSKLLLVWMGLFVCSILFQNCGQGFKTVRFRDLSSLAGSGSCASSLNLAWFQPTENEDNTPVDPLGGYRLSYGPQSQQYTNTVDIPDGSIESYTLTNLVPGDYFLAIKVYTTTNLESTYSSEISTTIAPCTATRINLSTGKVFITKLKPSFRDAFTAALERKITSVF